MEILGQLDISTEIRQDINSEINKVYVHVVRHQSAERNSIVTCRRDENDGFWFG
jgi:hypothetical protein